MIFSDINENELCNYSDRKFVVSTHGTKCK